MVTTDIIISSVQPDQQDLLPIQIFTKNFTIYTTSYILKNVVYILMPVIWDHIIHKYALIVP